MKVPSVFISSTFKDLRLEREYASMVCQELGFDVRFFPERSPGSSPIHEYMEHLQECHVLIYIATGHSNAVERELNAARRLGIPTIEMARVDPVSGAPTPTAMARRKVSPRFQVTVGSLADIRQQLRTALLEIIYKRFESPKRLLSFKPDAYSMATKAVDKASFRLGIVQETPTLILGPDKGKYVEERTFYEALQIAIDNVASKKRQLEVIYLFDAKRTRDEIARNPDRYPNLADALKWLQGHRTAIRSNRHVNMRGIDGPLSASFVHDASLEISTVLHDDRYYLWLDEVGGAANDFWMVLERLSQRGQDLFDFVDSLNV